MRAPRVGKTEEDSILEAIRFAPASYYLLYLADQCHVSLVGGLWRSLCAAYSEGVFWLLSMPGEHP